MSSWPSTTTWASSEGPATSWLKEQLVPGVRGEDPVETGRDRVDRDIALSQPDLERLEVV